MCCYSGKISYKIDKDQLVVSELFTILNSVKIQLGISDWGIKRTTLEDGEWFMLGKILYNFFIIQL